MSTPAKLLIATLLILGLSARFINLNAPPAGHHQWRQSDTAAVAKNMSQSDGNLLHPKVDWRKDTTGHVEMEFPIYCWTTAKSYTLLGPHHWIPRSLSITASLIALFIFYRLVKLLSDPSTALWSAAFFAALPLNIFFSRSIQPESWMLCSMLGATYSAALWSRSKKSHYLIAAALFAALSGLLKLPALVVGLPMLAVILQSRGTNPLKSPTLWAAAIASLIPVIAWYTHAHTLYQETGLTFGISQSDKWNRFELLLEPTFYKDLFVGKIIEDHLAIIGFPLAALGLIMRNRKPTEILFDAWLLAMLIQIVLVPQGHRVHDYYQLPIAVPAAFYIGRFLSRGITRSKHAPTIQTLLAAIFFILSSRTLWNTFSKELNPPQADQRLIGLIADNTNAGELVVLARDDTAFDPYVLYMANRKGWLITTDDLSENYINSLAGSGAGWLIVESTAGEQGEGFHVGRAATVTFEYDGVRIFLLSN